MLLLQQIAWLATALSLFVASATFGQIKSKEPSGICCSHTWVVRLLGLRQAAGFRQARGRFGRSRGVPGGACGDADALRKMSSSRRIPGQTE